MTSLRAALIQLFLHSFGRAPSGFQCLGFTAQTQLRKHVEPVRSCRKALGTANGPPELAAPDEAAGLGGSLHRPQLEETLPWQLSSKNVTLSANKKAETQLFPLNQPRQGTPGFQNLTFSQTSLKI